MQSLVFATNNLHKLEEVQAQVGDIFKITSLNEIGCEEDIEETGSTFEENASIKSNFIYKNYRTNCFADDSGLEVSALNNEPGIYSARYSGGRDSIKNLNLVLEKMEGIEDRRAQFRTVISLILNGKESIFEGIVTGNLTTQTSGIKGFGYDPIFVPDGYDITFAEMELSQKNKISHRAKAMFKLISFLKTQ
ncbi:MAG: RdgB/HAM1 family non-canonical purine NTP pyrophosphatase [Pelobium sp.]